MSLPTLNGRNSISKSEKGSTVFGCCSSCSNSDDPDKKSSEEEGIPKARGCTDVVYLIVYVVFCCIMILIAAFALVYGNPLRLINGMDSFGNVCGTTNENFGNMTFSGLDMTEKPYVFFFDLHDMDLSTKVCVSECPSERDLENMSDVVEFYHNTSTNLCRYDFNLTKKEEPFKMDFHDILCPKLPYPSSLPVLKRCIPKPSSLKITRDVFSDIYGYLNGLSIFKQILGDLAVTWVTVLGLTGIAFVISFSMIILVHWMTALVSYLILIAASLLSVGLTAFLWWTYVDIKSVLDSTEEVMILEEMAKNERAFLVYSIVATIFTTILLLIAFRLRKRVEIVVQLFREAGSALCAMPCLIIQPFLTYIGLTMFFCCWLFIVLCLATADYPTSRQIPLIPHDEKDRTLLPETATESDMVNGSDPEAYISHAHRNRSINLEDIAALTLIEYSDGAWVKYMWWIYILGLIWISEFILGCQQMVIASSVATWYFSRNRSTLKCVIMESIWRLIKYHIGSVALGSLVITLVKIPRLILSFSQRLLRKWEEWQWVKWISKSCSCCLSCFENCLKYIHHNAYTVIAIQGVDFCPATRLAFAALVQNALQVSVINSIGDFILFLAKCITAAITGLIAMIVFRSDESLYFYAIPVLLTVVFAYFVAHCVISVFEMAVDTLFLCFCEDHNMNDGTDGKEFYAPRTLWHYMTVDAVDAVAPGRRNSYDTSPKKQPRSSTDISANHEEIIPMNPTPP